MRINRFIASLSIFNWRLEMEKQLKCFLLFAVPRLSCSTLVHFPKAYQLVNSKFSYLVKWWSSIHPSNRSQFVEAVRASTSWIRAPLVACMTLRLTAHLCENHPYGSRGMPCGLSFRVRSSCFSLSERTTQRSHNLRLNFSIAFFFVLEPSRTFSALWVVQWGRWNYLLHFGPLLV